MAGGGIRKSITPKTQALLSGRLMGAAQVTAAMPGWIRWVPHGAAAWTGLRNCMAIAVRRRPYARKTAWPRGGNDNVFDPVRDGAGIGTKRLDNADFQMHTMNQLYSWNG